MAWCSPAFLATAAAGRSTHRSSTGDSVLESGAQVASVWLACRVGLGKQDGKGWTLPSICNFVVTASELLSLQTTVQLLPPHSVNPLQSSICCRTARDRSPRTVKGPSATGNTPSAMLLSLLSPVSSCATRQGRFIPRGAVSLQAPEGNWGY